VAFTAQIALLAFLGQRPHPPAPVPRFNASIHLAADAWSAQQLSDWPLLTDPTLFVWPNAQSFSGAAWLRYSPLQHRLSDWAEPPSWLGLDAGRLGRSFSEFVATNQPPPLRIAEKPLPPPTGSAPTVPNEPLAERSDLQIEGDLARHPLLTPVTLRSWPHTDLLTNTVVQVLVSSEGDVVSAVLLAESGLKTADDEALRLATGARFRPWPTAAAQNASERTVSWGKLIFQWHMAPPSASTNAP
jgi:hypothetical protein